MSNLQPGPTLPRALGDGLLLRRGRADDAAVLAEFNARTHMGRDATEPDHAIGIWTRDLLERPHPLAGPDDFLVVEDASGAIVSSTMLIGQRWSFDGVALGVGRPELVATHPDYRRRGLVREQFEVLHAWSRERGDLMQAITGIPFYYRQFGYEMAVDIGGGGIVFRQQVPKLKPGAEDAFRLRPAGEGDVPFIAEQYERGRGRVLLFAERDEAMWRFLLHGASAGSIAEVVIRIVETAAGEAVGFVAHGSILYGTTLPIFCCELRPGVSWISVVPSLLRGLLPVGDEIATATHKELAGIRFGLDLRHPLYDTLRSSLHSHRPYALYIRVPELPAFVRRVAPALERRLVDSAAEGHSGELRISMYRSGLRLQLENGRLAAAEHWQPESNDDGDAAFPGLSFLQLLFGHRSLTELRDTFPDCRAGSDAAAALLDALFPRRASQIWVIN